MGEDIRALVYENYARLLYRKEKGRGLWREFQEGIKECNCSRFEGHGVRIYPQKWNFRNRIEN